VRRRVPRNHPIDDALTNLPGPQYALAAHKVIALDAGHVCQNLSSGSRFITIQAQQRTFSSPCVTFCLADLYSNT